MKRRIYKVQEESFDHANISEDPEDYGSKGQNWSEEFVKYMKSIVTHPAYAKMPDAVKDDGKIQWEAPSNRSGGKYQYTHQKRRVWWQNKAKEIGVDTNADKWISRTAKTIHPTGEKPCKRCGHVLRLAYVYPQKNLVKRLKNKFGDDFEVSPIEPIDEIIQIAVDVFGDNAIDDFAKLLSAKYLKVPEFGNDLEAFLAWIEDEYVPSEPSLLSPGAMSNAPDRFDGFHSFNRCCRGTADKGRTAANLRTYSTDRRVFEYWSEGDWVAADRLMGLVRTSLSGEPNADGGDGLPTADHIGPLSLGFCHRPEFRLLSKEANSAKNNRMTLQDVEDLINAEQSGKNVVSWYAKPLWDLRKGDVDDEEKALRLSKVLRDNQRNAMALLSLLYDHEFFSLLVYLLELEYADFKIGFENLRAENFITTFDSISKERRNTKYSLEQKARRIRIGMEALRSFREKENRHLFLVDEKVMEEAMDEIHSLLKEEGAELLQLNDRIKDVIQPESGVILEVELRKLVADLPTGRVDVLDKCKSILFSKMEAISESISDMWNDDRYVRAPFEL
jgi:Alw26I/Eco31I/Esp3I family type II restriction endonuclease